MTNPGPVPLRGPGPFFLRRGVKFAMVLFAAMLLAVIGGVLYLQQWGAFPAPPPESARPQALAAARGQDLWFDVDGKRVEAWLLPGAASGAAPLLIYTHGNGELIDFWADRFEPIRAAGIHVLLVEYPGYGRSGGRPTEQRVTARRCTAHHRPRTFTRRWCDRTTCRTAAAGGADPRVDVHQRHGRSARVRHPGLAGHQALRHARGVA